MAKTYPLPKRLIDIHNHLRNEDGTQMLERMDKLGIEMMTLMGSSHGGEEYNRRVVKVARKWPDRYVGGACYDPREGKEAIRKLKHYCGEGLPIVKVFPNAGYFPDDDALIPFWDAVAELKMCVLSHCGWVGPSGMQMFPKRWATYYTHPERFEKVARTHADTIFIMAHFGGIAGVLESVMLSTRMPNIYIDCSPGQGLWAVETCGAIAGSVPPEKLMWGSDTIEPCGHLPRYHKALNKIGYGPHFQKVFFDNAAGIFDKLGFLPDRFKKKASAAKKAAGDKR